MRTSIFQLLLLCLVALSSCKDAGHRDATNISESTASSTQGTNTVDVNTEKSRVLWKGTKPTGEHNGYVKLKEGRFELAGEEVVGGSFILDMRTITNLDQSGTSKERLENHLKGTVAGKEDHFFNVNKFPTAQFVVHKIIPLKEGDTNTRIAYGELTVKDQTHPVHFPFTIEYSKEKITLKSQSFTIDRTLWGVNYGSQSVFDDLKDNYLNDFVGLVVEVEADL